nr:RagB/SusD family nutrient uptake outer membrane protein [uncultured Flavobacterium sp.]
MKLKNIKSIGFFAISSIFIFGSCSDEFLVEKENYETLTNDVFRYPVYAKQYVDRIYDRFLPGNNSSAFIWDLATGSTPDNFTKTTDELAGETPWNRVWGSILISQDHCLPYLGAPLTGSIVNNPYTRIRDINLFLEQIENFGMADADKKPLKGQMYFWRAYQYFELIKLYGGVPIVLNAQVPAFEGVEGGDAIKVSRSATSVCIDQIVSDLDKAKGLLPGKWTSAADWGRITSGAALALKGRVLLTWASPLFNRTDDVSRWQRAYDANTEAKALLEDNGFGLFVAGGTANGFAWGNMWNTELNNPEAVIVYGFNDSALSGLKNNSHESACRPKVISGAGSIAPTKQIVDAFPMIDGRPTTSPSSTYPYNSKVFYKNRDPRLGKTFAYNGSEWKYSQNTSFVLWTYSWKTAASNTTPNNYTEGNSNKNSTGIYLRKATIDNASNTNIFKNSGTDFIELRFAEVLLNLAESAIGINKLAEGKDLIGKVRARAGIINGDGSYGLASVATRDQHFAAVLNERKIEFAYENKRFHDLKRWMLFDNSTGQNTRLGIPQIDGTIRTGYFIDSKKTDGSSYTGVATADPFFVTSGNAPVVNRVITSYPYTVPPSGKVPGKVIANAAEYLEYLYQYYFELIEKTDLESTATPGWKFKWYPEYYFFGIRENLMNNAPYLEQTKGWNGGTFDPTK